MKISLVQKAHLVDILEMFSAEIDQIGGPLEGQKGLDGAENETMLDGEHRDVIDKGVDKVANRS